MYRTIDLLLGYMRPYYFYVLVAALVFIFSIVGLYMYSKIYTSNSKEQPFVDIANNPQTGKDIVITFYWVDWCPHCSTAKPEWNSFVDEYNNKNINGHTILCIDMDCSSETNDKITQILKAKNIDSFPTVKAVMPGDNGKEMTINFESKTSKKNLEKFVLSISSGK